MSEAKYIPIFLINLDRHTDRFKNMKARLKNLPFERIPAFDSNKLEELELKELYTKSGMPKWAKAVIISHKKIWKKIIDENMPFACILEDDVYLSDSFPDFMRDTNWLPGSFDVIKIEAFKGRVFLSHNKTNARERFLQQLGSTHLGSAGYILSQKGAKKLLNITQHPDKPIDNLMFEIKTVNSDYKVMQLIPALCIQEMILYPDSFKEDISDDRIRGEAETIPHTQKIWREVKRPYFQLLELIRVITEKLIIVRKVPFL